VTVSLVALTIALLVVVTGIATGLAADSTADDEADIRVVPEGAERSRPSSTSRARGSATPTRARRRSSAATCDDVAYATPVLTEAVRISNGGERRTETVLAMGVVPPDEPTEIEGVSTASLEPGDPTTRTGATTGRGRAKIVLTDAAADGIDAAAGDDLEVRGRCSKRRTGPSRTIGLRRTP